MAKNCGVMFTGTDGKKTRMDRNEFCRYIGNLWKVAREAKLAIEEENPMDESKEIIFTSDSGEIEFIPDCN